MNRQQRASRNRRIVRPNQPEIQPELRMALDTIDGDTAIFAFYTTPYPPINGGDLTKVQMSGVPQVYANNEGYAPISAELLAGEYYIRLTYPPGVLTETSTFTLGQSDPAIRTSTGGGVGPVKLAPNYLPGLQISWSAALNNPDSVLITAVAGDVYTWYSAANNWYHGPTNETPVRADVHDGQLELTFATPFMDGDIVGYSAPVLAGSGVAQPVPANQEASISVP